jgi:hypothetical protein
MVGRASVPAIPKFSCFFVGLAHGRSLRMTKKGFPRGLKFEEKNWSKKRKKLMARS